jgi:trk system potassium uptake protein TrkA
MRLEKTIGSSKVKTGIIGCGRFGSCLATTLAKRGAEVLAMDKDSAVVKSMSGVVTRFVEGDAADEDALKEAGFADCDAVVIAIGTNMEGSILAAMALKQIDDIIERNDVVVLFGPNRNLKRLQDHLAE